MNNAFNEIHLDIFKAFNSPLFFYGYHRCTRVENPGEGVRDVFAKIPRGSRLSEKIAWGVPLFCVLLHFY
jgi:hypothetical protein